MKNKIEQLTFSDYLSEILINKLPIEVVIFDTDHKYIFVNPIGIKDPEMRKWIIGRTDFDYCRKKGINEDIAIKRRGFFNDVLSKKSSAEWIDEHINKQGEQRFILRNLHPIIKNDTIEVVIGYGIDITEIKKAKREADRSKKEHRNLLYSMNDGFFIDDISGKVIYANKRFYEIFGLDETDMNKLNLEDYVAPEYHKQLRNYHDNRVKGKKVIDNYQYEGIRKDGEKIWIEARVTPVMTDGKITGTQSLILDITEQKRKNIELERLAELNRKIIDSSDELFYVVKMEDLQSFNNPIVYVSDKTEKFYGITSDELIKKPNIQFSLIHPDDLPNVVNTTNKLYITRKPVSRIYRSKNPKTEEYYWFYDFATPILNDKNEIIEVYGSIKNITHLKEKEDEISNLNIELLKIEEKERFRMAHELHDGVSQTLAALKMHLNFIDSEEGLTRIRKILDTAIAEVRQVSTTLAPKALIDNKLCKALQLLVDQVNIAGKLSVTINCSKTFEHLSLSEHIKFNIYRIVQENLNNTIKHANAGNVNISVVSNEKKIAITYTNDGNKIPDEVLAQPSCFISIKRRLSVIKGTFNIKTNNDGEVVFQFYIPYTAD